MTQSRSQMMIRFLLGVASFGFSVLVGAQSQNCRINCPPPPLPTHTTLISSQTAIYAGQDVTLTAYVQMGTQEGWLPVCPAEVAFFDGDGFDNGLPYHLGSATGCTLPAVIMTSNIRIGLQAVEAHFVPNFTQHNLLPSMSFVPISVFPNLGLYRPSTSSFIVDYDQDLVADTSVAFGGEPGDVALVGDVLGTRSDQFVIYRDGLWFVSNHWNGVADEIYAFGGVPGDIPLLADMNGDGKADLVIYRNGIWFVSTNRDGVADEIYYFGGVPGDIPLLAGMNGGGTLDLVIYRSGLWFVSTNRDGVANQVFGFGGGSHDIPLASNWNSIDNIADPIIFRDGIWFVGTHGVRDGTVQTMFGFGTSGDIPLLGAFR